MIRWTGKVYWHRLIFAYEKVKPWVVRTSYLSLVLNKTCTINECYKSQDHYSAEHEPWQFIRMVNTTLVSNYLHFWQVCHVTPARVTKSRTAQVKSNPLPACRHLLFPLLHAEKGRLRNAVANRVPASHWVPKILGTCCVRLTHSAHCST